MERYENMTSEQLLQLAQQKLDADKQKTELSNQQKIYELTQILPADNDLTDSGQAKVFVKWANNCIAWCASYGWLIYQKTGSNGGYWKSNADKEVEQLYLNFTDKQFYDVVFCPWRTSPDEQERKQVDTWEKFVKHCRQTHSTIKSVLGIASTLCNKPVEIFDSNEYYLNTQTGVVDLRTGDIIASDPKQYMRNITDGGLYDDDTMAKERQIWQEFLDKVVVNENGEPDLDYQTYLQYVVGLSAFGNVMVEKLFMAYGKGGNGKSTLFDSIADTLGTYALCTASDVLVDDGKSKNFQKAQLYGKRLVVMSELNQGVRLNTKLLKEICSTGNMSAEYKFKDSFEFNPVHTAIMYTNDLPSVPASDEGTWRRLSVMPFYAHFYNTKDETKNYTKTLIKTAKNAILEWIINGAVMVHCVQYKFDEPLCVQQLVSNYRGNENKALPFVQDCCVVDENADPTVFTSGIKTADLYKAYAKYAEDNGYDTANKKKFKQDIEQITGIPSRRSSKGEYYPCITLKSE